MSDAHAYALQFSFNSSKIGETAREMLHLPERKESQ